METEEERSAKLEDDAATQWLRLAIEMDEERKARLEKMVAGSYRTTHVRPDLKRCGRCGCGFVPQTRSEKLATMLIIQT